MVILDRAVFDAGPFIYIEEIKQLVLLNIFKKVLATNEILDECRRISVFLIELKNFEIKRLFDKSKDFAKYLIEKFNLDLGESTGIALCRQENISLFFTDDLDARNIAKSLGFNPHGTVAIILRSLKNNFISKNDAKKNIESLYSSSSLFFTRDLRDFVLREIDNFSR